MRADRLVSILMLLQRRGRVSAPELAETLEVSVRTIYRDMDALSASGIPVYAERGASGGFCLAESYRAGLTGLTADEAGALLLLGTPGPLDSLELGQKLKSALRKLYAALDDYPASQRSSPRVHLDWSSWGSQLERRPGVSAHLEVLYHAVVGSRQVTLAYRLPNAVDVEQTVRPLGLVAKAGAWYLVCERSGKVRWHDLADLLTVTAQAERFEYPAGFDLWGWWQTACAEAEADSRRFRAVVRAAPTLAALLRGQDGEGAPVVEEPDECGWVRLELQFASLEAARYRLLGFGNAVEVVEPLALRYSLADYARQIADLYEGR